jgi:hypothetical protein
MKKDLKIPKTVGLSQKVLDAIKAKAKADDRSESWIVNNILERELQA